MLNFYREMKQMTKNLILRELARKQGIKLDEEIAVKADDIDSDAKQAVERINSELVKVLGSRYVVKAVYSSSLGKSIHLRIHDTKPMHNIAHNSPVFMQFMMYLSTSFGRNIDLKKVSYEMSQGPRSVPFRKITSKKSIKDATDKLIQWFSKNKPALDQLIKDSE